MGQHLAADNEIRTSSERKWDTVLADPLENDFQFHDVNEAYEEARIQNLLTKQMIINSSKFQDSNSLEINEDSFLSIHSKRVTDVEQAAAAGEGRD